MSEDTLTVEARETRGTQNAKRLRATGKIPAILYGHGKESLSLTLDSKEVATALKHDAHLVKLTGATNESALFKDIQWDPFGSRVLHVDLTRVDADELVTVEVRIKIRGEAPGIKMGGVVNQPVRTIEIECPASEIPEELEVKISELELGQAVAAGDVELPKKVQLKTAADTVLVICSEPSAESEVEAAAAADGAEPEVIGGSKSEEEGGGE